MDVHPVPVLIPGAREARVSRPGQPVATPAATTQPARSETTVADQGQLEYERQGGGAPSERRLPGRPTLLARLGAWLFR